MRTFTPSTLLVVLLLACGGNDEGEETPGVADTTATAPGGAVGTEESAVTTIGGPATTATSSADIGAPEPPDGYPIDSRPADAGKLARIEYVSPRTVGETTSFYDSQMHPQRRVELEVAGDNIVVYATRPGTAITTALTYTDLQRLLEERTEPMVVVSPATLQRDDPLIADLRSAGLNQQADDLLLTKSKVTVIYALP